MTTINITKTRVETITIEGPAYRKWGSSYYRIDEFRCVKVCKNQIEAFSKDLASPWEDGSEDCTDIEFYEQYMNVRQQLDELVNLEINYIQ